MQQGLVSRCPSCKDSLGLPPGACRRLVFACHPLLLSSPTNSFSKNLQAFAVPLLALVAGLLFLPVAHSFGQCRRNRDLDLSSNSRFIGGLQMVGTFMRSTFVCLAGLSLAYAQNAEPPRFTFNVGGGFTKPIGHLEDRIDTGWNVQA